MKKALLILAVLVATLILIKTFVKTNPNSTAKQSSQKDEQIVDTKMEKCLGISTTSQTEGPYYKSGSPQRNNISEGLEGNRLIVTGFVFNKNCERLANTWLDFWQADANGVYDNAEYKLRGHQFTDENGIYRLETIVPAEYGSRPPHIHVKIKSANGTTLTSQLYFPNASKNQTDPIFNQALIININEEKNIKFGTFNFVLDE